MKKISVVLSYELLNTLRKPSFLLMSFGIPFLAVLIFAGIKIVQERSGDNGVSSGVVESGGNELEVEGYVDHSGLISQVPEDLPPNTLYAYANEEVAELALSVGEISAYYIIPADYVQGGEVFYVYPEGSSLVDDRQKWVIQWTLLVNILGGDIDRAASIWNPAQLQWVNLAPTLGDTNSSDDSCTQPGFACQSNELVRALPAVMVVLFFISFMAVSNMMFSNIGTEKENRTIEVLMLSLSPRQMLTGKMIGLGIAGLLQTLAWLTAMGTVLSIGGNTLKLPDEFVFPVPIFLWSVVFYLGGYALYTSLMAGLGALVPKIKEAGSMNMIAMSPLFLGYVVGIMAPLAELTNAPLPVALSLFPLTAPVVMVMRLVDGSVPLWQVFLSAGLMYASVILVLRAVAAMFHAQNLLSGQPFTLKRYLGALVGVGSN